MASITGMSTEIAVVPLLYNKCVLQNLVQIFLVSAFFQTNFLLCKLTLLNSTIVYILFNSFMAQCV